jgi:hypothetical protein
MYSFEREDTALGAAYRFIGPGLRRYANTIHFMQFPTSWGVECIRKDPERIHLKEAESIAYLLAEAYEAGRQAAKKEIREILGVL